MRLDKEERLILQKFKAFTGKNPQECRELYEFLLASFITDYLANESTRIPLIGEFKLKFDDVTEKITLDFTPADTLKNCLIQAYNGEEMEIESLFRRKFNLKLEDSINSEDTSN